MITVISSTNRENALTRHLAHYYQSLLDKHQVKSKLLDLQELPHDFSFSALYQNSGKNERFNQFQQVIDEQDKFVFIVPEYNGSFPGILKTFIDGLRYPDSLADKKAALVGLSSGIQGGALALSHLSDILSYLGTDVLGLRVRLHQIHEHFKNNRVTHPLFNELLEQQIERFIDF